MYNIPVIYEWDERTNEANIAAGRPGFEAIEDFEWDAAVVERSDRYGETRWTALGLIGNHLHHIVYTRRNDKRRIISLRRASPKERKTYAERHPPR